MKPRHYLQIRDYSGTDWVSVWLMRRDGAAEQALMWGEVARELAEALALATGLPVERERSKLRMPKSVTAPECTPVAEQTLFPEGA